MVKKKLVFPCENRLQISVSFNHGISIGNKAWERKWLPQFKRHAFSIIVFQGCIPRGSYFESGKNINTCKSNHRSWRKSLWRPFDNHFSKWNLKCLILEQRSLLSNVMKLEALCLFDQAKLNCQRKLRLPPVVTLKSDFIFDNVLKMRLAKSDLISVLKYLALGNLSNFYLTSVSKVSEQTIYRQMSFSWATWHIHSNFKRINCERQLLSENFYCQKPA